MNYIINELRKQASQSLQHPQQPHPNKTPLPEHQQTKKHELKITINYSLKTMTQTAYSTGAHLKDQLSHKNKIY